MSGTSPFCGSKWTMLIHREPSLCRQAPILSLKTADSAFVTIRPALLTPFKYFPYYFTKKYRKLCRICVQIKDIQENDAGKYQCQVLLTVTEKISADVAVSVRIPPIIFDNSTRSVVVSEGEAVKLECYAGGYPAPTVRMFIYISFHSYTRTQMRCRLSVAFNLV